MKRIIARISNGLGNQMFLYASAFSISKKLNRILELDNISAFKTASKKKEEFKKFHSIYELDIFNISSKKTLQENTFNNFYRSIFRKFLMFEDKFNSKKNFFIETKDKDKKTKYINNFVDLNFKDTIYLEGYFESEKYFKDFRKDIINEFTFKKKIDCKEKFLQQIKNSNSVSICIRADRFNEKKFDDLNTLSVNKSLIFEREQFDYIIKGINFLKNKINDPRFYLFSNNISKVSHLFKNFNNITFVNEYKNNKVHEDFFLMSQCKHHIVAPTTFHFWPAWLSEYEYKICIRPKNLNISNNIDYWPEQWISI